MAEFTLIPLGCSGGPDESNLSAYLLRVGKELLLLDAGSVWHGLTLAHLQGAFTTLNLEDESLSPVGKLFSTLSACLISHSHLDHVGGLVIASQVGKKMPIMALAPTLHAIQTHLFNGVIWPKYENYITLQERVETPIPHTTMKVEAYPLIHAKECPSTAFLITSSAGSILYFGDTSSDKIEKGTVNKQIWERAAIEWDKGHLKALLLECSFTEEKSQPLYGHLSPSLFFYELNTLAALTQRPLHHLNVIVTHRKETALKKDAPGRRIEEELKALNTLGVNLIFPQQGKPITL